MIVDGQPTKWARALHRAEAHNLIVTQVETVANGPDELLFYKARSVSRPGSVIHGIAIECTARGVDVKCSCEGAQKGYPCMHAATALRSAGLLPDIQLIETDDAQIAA